MSRYDGLIIPRSYSEYINKTDAATLQQALQLSGVLSGAVAAGDNKAVKSDAVNTALATKQDKLTFDTTPTAGSTNPVTSGGVANRLSKYVPRITLDTAQSILNINYDCFFEAVGSVVTDLPTTDNYIGQIEVFDIVSNFRRITCYNANENQNITRIRTVYTRDCYGDIWGAWHKLVSDASITPIVKPITFESIVTTTERENCTYTVIGKLCIVNLAGISITSSGNIAINLPKAKTRANEQWPFIRENNPIFFIDANSTILSCTTEIPYSAYTQLIYPIAE